MICEILEEDFRKLDLVVLKTEKVDFGNVHRYMLVEKHINDILDEEIKLTIEEGCESSLVDLKTPVTIAIHIDPTTEDYEECIKTYSGLKEYEAIDLVRSRFVYLDKFMNSFTGARTYQIGWGIQHLYSTRDYYECHDDYWRVRKSETKVVYRIHLDKSWLDKFILKHKTVVSEVIEKGKHWVEDSYDLINNEWVLIRSTEVIKHDGSTEYKPYLKKS